MIKANTETLKVPSSLCEQSSWRGSLSTIALAKVDVSFADVVWSSLNSPLRRGAGISGGVVLKSPTPFVFKGFWGGSLSYEASAKVDAEFRRGEVFKCMLNRGFV